MYLCGQSSRILLCLLVLIGSVSLTGCSGTQALKLLTGGGPSVLANTQAGKTNNQTIGTSTVTEQKLVRPQARTINQTSDTNRVRADSVKTVVVNEVPTWIILLLVLGWLLPSPGEISRKIKNAFRKKL